MVYDELEYAADVALIDPAAPTIAEVTMIPIAADELPNRCSYSPPPFDVISAGGQPAAAFSDFPVSP